MTYGRQVHAALTAAERAQAEAQRARHTARMRRREERREWVDVWAQWRAATDPEEKRRLRELIVEQRQDLREVSLEVQGAQVNYRQAAAALRTAADAVEQYDDYLTRAELRMPWLPTPLANLFAESWVEYGTFQDALAAVRASEQYARFFPGLRRDDGTLRMTETQYLGVVASYEDALSEFGINNQWLRARIPELIEGEVSADEFRSRIAAMDERIMAQGPELRRIYADYFGVEGISDRALLAAALDPTLRVGLLNRQISMAEIGGAAAEAGFAVGRGMAGRLFRAEVGLDRAATLFQTAAEVLPDLRRAAKRQHEGRFGLSEFLEAEAFGSAVRRAQLRRTLAGEASSFTEQQGYTMEEGALTGLRPR